MPAKMNISGKRFGLLQAVEMVDEYRYPNGERTEKWLCTCDCGNKIVVFRKNLIAGNTASCGCKRIASNRERLCKHGGKGSQLYNVWCSMKYRCYNTNDKNYNNYGGRGITVCTEWLHDYSSFKDWANKSGYSLGLTIDRIDVNGNYSPENCRWVDYTTQCNNRRNSIYVSYNGETHSLSEWSRITGINYYTLHNRYEAGMPPEEILSYSKLKTGPKSS